ncbi:MAG: homoaconitate hydratase [Theionarchaea archaeon]|nr:homoaconitate hydratase [Theionarchaea archaeon]
MIHIWDETLRDGEQTPGVILTKEEKIELAKALDDIGVSLVVCGFPINCEIEAETIRTIAREGLTTKTGAVARGRKEDVDECLRCETDEIVIFVPSSDIHITHKLRKTHEDVLDMIRETVQYASDHVTTNFVAEDATRSDFDFLISCFRCAVEAGASRVVIADTVGTMYPPRMKVLIEQIASHISVPLSVHCHNDMGLATANTLAAVEGGVTYPQVTINGYGERAGNAPLDEVVMGIETLLSKKTGIKINKLYELSQLAEKYIMIPVHQQKPLVGEKAFSHEAGIHVHGLLKDRKTYEVMDPRVLNRETHFIIGKHTGDALMEAKLKELGFSSDKTIRRRILNVIIGYLEIHKSDRVEQFELAKRNIENLTRGMTDKELRKVIKFIENIDIMRQITGDEQENL